MALTQHSYALPGLDPLTDSSLREISTPLDPDKLFLYLEGYDELERRYLYEGFSRGFFIGFQGDCPGFIAQNSASILKHPLETRSLIEEEINLGRIAGPFPYLPFEVFQISPIAIIPKADPGKFRLLHNLSAPYNKSSINANIPDSEASVNYAPVQVIIDAVRVLGKSAHLAKSDIKSAFRIVPVNPAQYHLMGFCFEGMFYVNKCLAMGARSSCRIFERFSTALQWICEHKFNMMHVSHLIDDFCFVSTSHEKCLIILSQFKSLCEDLGVPLSEDKTVGPSSVLTFLGVEIDAVRCFARLPKVKLDAYTAQIVDLLDKNSCTLAELRTLIGRLNWAASLIRVGRSFMRNLIGPTKGLRNPNVRITLTESLKQELSMWLSFLSQYNGYSFFKDHCLSLECSVHVYTDASPIGAGIVVGNLWSQLWYDERWAALNIATLELYPILVAMHVYVISFKHRKVVFHCDNMAVVHLLNRRSCKCPVLMSLMRRIALKALMCDITFASTYIASELNVKADYISRFSVSQVKLKQMGLALYPVPVPEIWHPRNCLVPS